MTDAFMVSAKRKHKFVLDLFLLFLFYIQFVRASKPDDLANSTKPLRQSTPATDITGRLCMTVENFKSGVDLTTFYECSPLSDQEVKEYKLADKYLGIWNKRDCPENFEFDETKQRCIENRKLRRQQAECGANPASQGCQAPCLATNQNPDVGAPCNWLTAKLQPDPLSSSYFLQCTIQNPGETCGEWVRSPCTPGTEFDYRTQVCVPSNFIRANPCGSNALPICPCAQGASGAVCPGQAACQNNVCCEGITMDFSLSVPQQSPGVVCVGSNAPPISSCYPSCPSGYQCQENIGCCPSVQSSAVIVPQSMSMALCPDYTPPIGYCSNANSCPSGYACNNNLGGCCQQQASDPAYTAVILCPGGTPALGPCGRLNQCPDGQGCYKGACCPMVCPQGLSPNGFCDSNSCNSGSCLSGCCCSERPSLPICSNGKTAVTICIRGDECGPGMECSNGGCCAVSYCPSGIQSIGRCINNGNCGTSGVVCLEGLCCPLPPCNNGGLAIGVCSVNSNCGTGFECQNFGCCPLPKCPTGGIAIKRCGKGASCCPKGAGCVNDLCCELPVCATGAVAIGFCNKKISCNSGAQCVSGACCPLPRCPTGTIGSQFCQFGSACPSGQICANGVCCNLPTCSYTGQIAMSVCGVGNACPMGYVCEGRGCCPEPMPLCPNGGRATQKCNRGVDCPPGYGCTPMGGCCLLSLDPVCPRNQNAICQCSSSNSCPDYATCNMGTCCTSSLATYNIIPGGRCQYNTQCNGNSYSSCQKNTCVCTKGSYSNGVTCNSPNVVVLNRARNGCDQYGSPCKYVFSTARRKPIFAPVNNQTETPLWFSVSSDRSCLSNDSSIDFDSDNTCLPSEKCIDGKCKLKLWPGEYGCRNDLECSSRCPTTYCEAKSDKNVPQCQCKSGLLLYSRCFEKCPKGFHESGAYCMHDDEDAFWENADAQENLQKLLNDGEC